MSKKKKKKNVVINKEQSTEKLYRKTHKIVETKIGQNHENDSRNARKLTHNDENKTFRYETC